MQARSQSLMFDTKLCKINGYVCVHIKVTVVHVNLNMVFHTENYTTKSSEARGKPFSYQALVLFDMSRIIRHDIQTSQFSSEKP